MRVARLVAVILCLAVAPTHAARPVPASVTLGHRLNGEAAAALGRLVERFNAAEKSGSVSLIQLPREAPVGPSPNLLLIDDDDGRFLAGRRYEPLHRFLPANGARFDPRQLYPALRDAVDDAGGRVQALPFAMALPVLYWNKAAFRRAGLSAETPPRTWWALQEAAGKLFDAGVRCPYASSWPVWVHLENTSTQHNEPFLSAERGATRLSFNSLMHVKHIALLSSWFKSRYLHLFGAADEADARFASGECAVLTSSSNLLHALKAQSSLEFGVADLPYYDDAYAPQPGNVVPAGAAIWALAAKPRAENRLAARFLAHLLEPAVQREWVAATGFLPMTVGAGVSEVAGLGRSPGQLLGRQLSERRQVSAVRSRSADEYGQVRHILGEELGAVWADRKAPKEALDAAVRRGNAVLNGSAPAPRIK